jgi:6-phosphogluconolactonase
MTNSKLEIYPNLEGLNYAAAERLAAIASEAISDRDRFMVVLSGGDTPLGLYRKLTDSPFKERLVWGSMHIFWSDERRVDQNESLSNYHQAWVSLLGRVPIPSDHVHKIQSDIDPDISAANYNKELKLYKNPPLDWPVFDLILLGLGVDGHTASIFPDSSFHNTDAVVAAHGRYKDRPSERVTMTPAVINSSREIIFLVNGAEKSAILSRILDGPYDPEVLPAQRIRPLRGNLTWMVDQEAARELKNRSV